MSLSLWNFDELITALKLNAALTLLNGLADSAQTYLKMFVRTHLQKLGISSPQNGYYLFNDSTKTAQVFVDGRWYELQMIRADYDVSGTVTNALSGLPLAGVAVTANGNQTTATDASGNYSLSNVPKGAAVTVGGSLSGYNPYSGTVNLASADNTKSFTMARRTISGNITSSLDGSVVSGVTVEIAALPRSTSSNGSGNYSLIDVPDGAHTLAASKTGYVSYSSSISVSADQVRNIVMDPLTYTVSGTVTSSVTGSAINGVTVTIGTRPNVSSNVSGVYSRDTVPDGTHAVAASKSGTFNAYSGTVTVSGANQTKNFVMVPLVLSVQTASSGFSGNGGSGSTYGYRFTLNKPMRVTQIGFYNLTASSRTYRLDIWNSSGTALLQQNVTGSASGWIYANLGSPITLAAGTYTLSGRIVSGASQLPFGVGNVSHPEITFVSDVYANGSDTYPNADLSWLPCRGWDIKVEL